MADGLEPMRIVLEELYATSNRRELAAPDPVVFLYRYPDPRDREIAALIASSLAFGRVAQIHRSVAAVLDAMDRPRSYIERTTPARLQRALEGFRHRWVSGDQLATMLSSVRRLIARYETLEAAFAAGIASGDVCGGLRTLVSGLHHDGTSRLLALPERGSACKRLNLFLRWMVRQDAVDPGGWTTVTADALIVPLDTHMHRIGRLLGFTTRAAADMRAALEITEGFRRLCPSDPVRYDFALTRLGMGPPAELDAFIARWNEAVSQARSAA